jgi:hypothetical protein
MTNAIIGDREWRPHYIWGDLKGCNKQSLYLFFRPISPVFFVHLFGWRVDNGILINLEHETESQVSSNAQAKQIGRSDKDSNLIDAFDEWVRWGCS